MKRPDHTGQVFGRLTVIRQEHARVGREIGWLCQCSCGTTLVTTGHRLRKGRKRSCGCLTREATIASHTTHGMWRTRLYGIWANMKQRCRNPRANAHRRYGARGVAVCDEWSEFQAFADWSLANGYREDLSIDRIDVNGDYEPDNCRWATQSQQQRNKRTTKLTAEAAAAIRGDSRSYPKIAADYGVSAATVRDIKVGRLWAQAA